MYVHSHESTKPGLYIKDLYCPVIAMKILNLGCILRTFTVL